MAKRKSESEPRPEVTLEAAMTELSQIVTNLESGQESLDESLAQFERGMSLLRICHRKLDAAAQRIELVTQLSPEARVAFLAKWENHRLAALRSGFQALKRLAVASYYGNKTTYAGLGYPGPPELDAR